MSSLSLQPKKCLIIWEFPMKNVVKIFGGFPLSSLGGVHLISGIAHLCATECEMWVHFQNRRDQHLHQQRHLARM